ncbi:MAG: carbohydrate ABC transporter permease [Candidatus Rokuibacteriota bacterium]
MRRPRRRPTLARIGRTVLTVVYLGFALGPVLWLAQMSLKTEVEAFRMPPQLLFVPSFQNYAELFKGPFLSAIANSFKASALTTLLCLAFGVPAAYALARGDLRREMPIRLWILCTRMAPPIAFALPFYLAFRALGLIDTVAGLSIIYLTLNLSLVIWLTQDFFERLPRSLEEAAYIDGASTWQAFARVTLPLAMPGVLTAGIFSFLVAWNDFFFALILTRAEAQTAPVAIMGYTSFLGWDWGKIAAGSTLVMAPSLLFALLVRRYLISGLTSGALKG